MSDEREVEIMANLSSFKVSCNKVNAEIYIVNMIVGSYFISTKKNELKGKRIDYSLFGKNKQEETEALVINRMEKLPENVLGKLKELQYELIIEPSENGTILRFRTGFEGIICFIDKRGKLVDLRYIEEDKEKNCVK